MIEEMFSIAQDFSPNPGPRFRRQGPFSGEALQRKLATLLEKTSGRITVILDGTSGIGSSFLDEAFGGLVRNRKYTKEVLLSRFTFVSKLDPTYIEEILESIELAEVD